MPTTGASTRRPSGEIWTTLRGFETGAPLPFEHLDTQNVQVIPRFTALSLPGHRGRHLVIEYGPRNAPASMWWGIAGVPAWVQEGTYSGYEYSIYENRLNALMTTGPKLGMADGSTRRMYFETWPRPTPVRRCP